MTENIILTRPARSVCVRYDNHAWSYTRYMEKLSPDFEITIQSMDVVHRDGKPVELQLYVKRMVRESRDGGNRESSARIFIRTVSEEFQRGSMGTEIWHHDYDPLTSNGVGSNSKSKPFICTSIDVGEYEDTLPPTEDNFEKPVKQDRYSDVLDPNFRPDPKELNSMVTTDDPNTIMSEILSLCVRNGFDRGECEGMFLRLAYVVRDVKMDRFNPPGGL